MNNHIEKGMGVPKRKKTPVKRRKTIQTKRKKKKNNAGPLILVFLLLAAVIAIIIVIISFISSSINSEEPVSSSEPSASSTVFTGNVLDGAVLEGRKFYHELELATTIDTSSSNVQDYGTMVTIGSAGYEYYKFDLDTVTKFYEALNKSVENIDESVKIYNIIVPTATDVMLPLSFLQEKAMLTSDQEKSIQYIYNFTDEKITNIEVYANLKLNSDKKLYFNTDSSLTSLGSYYMYSDFMTAKGLTAPEITSFSTDIVTGFVGDIVSDYQANEIDEPENIQYYIPNASLKLSDNSSVFQVNGEPENVFLGGQRDITEIINTSIPDTSSIVIVGDDNIYSLAPFIAQDYQTTYVVDYSLFDGSIADFVDEKSATSVLYCFDVLSTITDSKINKIN